MFEWSCAVLAPTCHDDDDGTMTGDEFVTRNTPHLAAMRKRAGREGSMSYDPCISRQTPLYMHRPDVLVAIHASSHPNPRWPSDQPGWAYGDEKEDIALLFPKFFKQAPHWNIGASSKGPAQLLAVALTCMCPYSNRLGHGGRV